MRSGMSRKARYLSAAVAATAAVATSGTMVFTSSSAAFTASTANPGNTWTTGAAPVLTDDDSSDTVMFNATNLGPGDTGQRCIAVTSTSTNPTRDLRFYTTRADSNTLGTQLTITVERGTGGTFANCSGFSSAATIVNTTLDQVPGTYAAATGTSVTVASGTATTVYRISYSLPSNLSSTYASRTTQATFNWEIR